MDLLFVIEWNKYLIPYKQPEIWLPLIGKFKKKNQSITDTLISTCYVYKAHVPTESVLDQNHYFALCIHI